MKFESKTVSIDSIDIKDTRFKISTPKPIESLALSISQFGLLALPIIKAFHGGYIVVSGFHRVRACRMVGWKDIEARIIGDTFKDLDCLKISITDNSYNRQMDLIEQSIALSKLATFYDDENVFIENAKALGFSDNPSYIKKLQQLHALIPELQQSIISGAVTMTMALEIAKLDNESMLQMIDLFETLRPTLNQQKEMFIMIKEISKVSNCTVATTIKDKNIMETIYHPDLARVQKIKELRAYLHKLRFPNISTCHARFNALVLRLKLPNKVKLIPPEHFEDVGYSMMLRFDSLQEFESYLNALNDLSYKPEFKSILKKDFANQSILY